MPANTVEIAVRQHAQQTRLQIGWHIADFIKKQGAPLGLLKAPAPLRRCTGEGTTLVAKQLALEQRFRQAAAVDGDEVALASRARLVQAARDEFLAGAGFALDQHVGGAVGEPGDHLPDALHREGVADQARFDLVAAFEAVAQVAHLDDEAALLERAAHDFDEILGRKRLLDEVVGAVLHRLHGHRDVAVAGDQDDGQFGVDGLHLAQEGHAVHARQADVADDDAAEVLLQPALALFGAADALGRDAFELQRLLAAEADVGVVLDD